MDDQQSRTNTPVSEIRSEPTGKSRLRRWLWGTLAVIVIGPALLMAIWTEISLKNVYAKGDRAGYVQKFSEKGWVCKTWEGELAMVNIPGAAPEKFYFSVRDDSVATQVTKLLGGHVDVTYEQHRGVPGSCFGETEYYVTAIRAIP